MNRSLLLLLLLLLLALAAGSYLIFAGGPPVDPGPGIEPEAEVETSGPDTLQGGGAGDRVLGLSGEAREAVVDTGAAYADEPAAYRAALCGVRGRLIWAGSRKPISGVEIKIAELWMDAFVPKLDAILGMEDAPSPVVFKGATRTDRAGEFVIRGVHSRAVM